MLHIILSHERMLEREKNLNFAIYFVLWREECSRSVLLEVWVVHWGFLSFFLVFFFSAGVLTCLHMLQGAKWVFKNGYSHQNVNARPSQWFSVSCVANVAQIFIKLKPQTDIWYFRNIYIYIPVTFTPISLLYICMKKNGNDTAETVPRTRPSRSLGIDKSLTCRTFNITYLSAVVIVCSVQQLLQWHLCRVFISLSLCSRRLFFSVNPSVKPLLCLNFSLSLSSHLFFRGSDSVSLLLSISSLAESLIDCLQEYFTLLLLRLPARCERNLFFTDLNNSEQFDGKYADPWFWLPGRQIISPD